MEIPSYKLQFLGYISNGDMRSLPQRDSQSILYLVDVCEQACNVFPCSVLGVGVLGHEKGLSFLLYSGFSLSYNP